MHYLLFYEKAGDYAAREGTLRLEHQRHVNAAVERGELVLGGALGDPVGGANVVLFRGESAAVAETFAKNDPYVHGGIVVRWRVRSWETVVGRDAERPLAAPVAGAG